MNMKVRITSCALGLALCGVASTASAQSDTPNVYNVTLDNVFHVSNPMAPWDGLFPSSAPGFSADFSASKYLQINFLAPAGEQFVYTPAVDTDFSAVFSFGSGSGETCTLVNAGFLGDNGQGPTDIQSDLGSYSGGLDFSFQADAPTGFSFTGFTATIELPADYSNQFTDASLDDLEIIFSPTMPFEDPGQQVTLQPTPTPEPSTMALAALGGAALLLYRRRK